LHVPAKLKMTAGTTNCLILNSGFIFSRSLLLLYWLVDDPTRTNVGIGMTMTDRRSRSVQPTIGMEWNRNSIQFANWNGFMVGGGIIAYVDWVLAPIFVVSLRFFIQSGCVVGSMRSARSGFGFGWG